VAAAAFAGPTPTVRMEANVYYANYADLAAKLGPLLGELDVCSHVDNQEGRSWLIIDTDADQLRAIAATGLRIEVTWPDIRDKFRAMTGRNPDDGSFRDFGYFFNYWEMRDTIAHLAQRYPAITAIDTSMRSFQNRAIWRLKLSDHPESTENEPQVFINGAIHAREPMGTHTCVGFAAALCANYGVDSLTTWLVNNREIYIVPVQNVDGYVYNSDSGGASANWRKNRNPTGPRTGPGVDLNRNYGYKWAYDDINSSPTPSSEVYRGPSRFSEPESQVFRALQAAHKFRTEMDFHTYGRSNMYPWGYAAVTPPDQAVLAEMCDTLEVYNGYASAQASGVNGVSFDWEYSDTLWNGVHKFVTYAFTSELGITDFWYGSNDLPYITAEVARNVPNCYYLTRVAGVWLEPLAVFVNDTALGNGNGVLDPGEAATLWFRLKNRAIHPLDTAKTVTAVLLPSDTMIQVLTPFADFPSIPRRTTADNRASQFTVQCSPDITPGETLALRLEVTFTDDSVTIMQPLPYRIIIGSSPVAVTEGATRRTADDSRLTASVANGIIYVHEARGTNNDERALLLDITGRRVQDLRPGPNDVSRLTPGVYFIREAVSGQPSAVSRKVVIQR
jgi:hypothetical protein